MNIYRNPYAATIESMAFMEITDRIVILGLFFAIIAMFYPVFKDILSDPPNRGLYAWAIFISAGVAVVYIVALYFISGKR